MLNRHLMLALVGAAMVAGGCSSKSKDVVEERQPDSTFDAQDHRPGHDDRGGGNWGGGGDRGRGRRGGGRWDRRDSDLPRGGEVLRMLGKVRLGDDRGGRGAGDFLDVSRRANCGLTHIRFTADGKSAYISGVKVTYMNGESDRIDLNDRDDRRGERGRGDRDGRGRRRHGDRDRDGIFLEPGRISNWIDLDDVEWEREDGRQADGRCIKGVTVYGTDMNRQWNSSAVVVVDGYKVERRFRRPPGRGDGRDGRGDGRDGRGRDDDGRGGDGRGRDGDGRGGDGRGRDDHGGGRPNPPSRTAEQCYLDRYPDICKNSPGNFCKNPKAHYEQHGRREGRTWGCQ